MSHDRLAEMKEYELSQIGSLSQYDEEHTGMLDDAFYGEISDISDDLRNFDSNITLMSRLHSQEVDAVGFGNSKNSVQLERLTEETRQLSSSLKKRLQMLQSQPVTAREANIRRPQIERVRSKFMDAIQTYQSEEKTYRDKQKERIKRQYKIVNPNATTEEIEQVVNSEAGSQVFAQATMGSRYNDSQGAYREVQKRHEEIKRIEKTLVELAQLFTDMSLLVEQQSEIIDNIEEKTETAKVDIEAGKRYTDNALISAFSSRKKRWICFGLSLVIILILAVCITFWKIQAGAGISTSAGIPDFRSPDTGLYANLARLKLPYPEAVFDISFFKRNPRPFYVLAHELAPGKFRPTPTHSFIRLLAEKNLLHTCFTQNIDTLERAAGVPSDKIIEAHGSFADQHCIKCRAPYPHDKIKAKIEEQEIPVCEKPGCGGYVKPDIVFFGEDLPPAFSAGVRHLRKADLLIVMGTSLTVYPFASLTGLVPKECPRLLLNLEDVGDWGSRTSDVTCLMPCDRAVRELCKLLGWEDDLERLWAETDLSPKEMKKEAQEVSTEPGEKPLKTEKADTAVISPEGDAEQEDGKDEAMQRVILKDIVDELAESVGGVKLEDEAQRVPEKSRIQDAPSDNNGGLARDGPVRSDESQHNSAKSREDSTELIPPSLELHETALLHEEKLVTNKQTEIGKL
ncbi:hypothetical protein EW145_g847 [Phellinidium pouzarii]|uniref:t-SNARE coiled-coil homology domain-containing protein n=1 Tax=Phellinidium pouzarii TaxID=167371 RepID=A0A4S4LHC0_9AGAM|nr:hypothetical protein EW145_g847 [Phellinidium pouzarii]